MKRILQFVLGCFLGVVAARAQSPVTLSIDTRTNGAVIPDDFMGLSFGMKTLLPNKVGAHFFSPTNTPLITLFQNIGLRHFRAGGTTVESPPATGIPGEAEIDNLFAFAQAAGVKKIIYSLRLLETVPGVSYLPTNVALASYIWSHYRPQLEYFSLGNEPDRSSIFDKDLTIRDFPTYIDKWRKFAGAITSALPQAKFAGPDGGSGNILWTTQFADAEKDSGVVGLVTEHFYAGGKGKGIEPAEGIETMLSAKWLKNYQKLYDKMAAPVLKDGLPYSFTEANDHYSGGIRGASDTFAGALWALDFLHWWAMHSTRGIDFHNTEWVSSDIIAPDSAGHLTVNPKAYGLKAFDLGGHGAVLPVAETNPNAVNLTAYAVQEDENIFVTVINKEYGPDGRAADLRIVSAKTAKRAEAIFLTVAGGDVAAKTGVTLGRVSIDSDGPWRGKWTPLPDAASGPFELNLPAASAAVVKISLK